VIGVEQGLADERADVGVTGPVEHAAAVPAGAHQPGEAEFRQVLGDRGARDPDGLGERADVVLPRRQQPHQTQPGGVAEHPEGPDGGLHLGAGGLLLRRVGT
jgi:hypothetical protein